MDYCPRCMSLLAEGATACDRCGAKVDDTPFAAALAEFDTPEEAPASVPQPAGPAETVAVLPVPVPAAKPATTTGMRELLVLALGILGTGALTFAVLMLRGGATPEAAGVTTRAAARPAAAAPVTTAPPARWTTVNSRPWIAKTKNNVAFELAADHRVSAWMRTVQPLLVVRCQAGDVDVFVFTDTAARIEQGTDDHTVRFALDDDEETTERWLDSSEHDGLFAPNGPAFLQRLSHAKTMRFEFTPHNAEPATVHFNVDGLADAMAPVARKCRVR